MDDTERKIRLDTIIAICAFLVSTLAALSSVATTIIMSRQTQVIAQQLSSTVWPYVSIGVDLSNTRATFSATNDGLGPAIMRALVVRVDGKPQKRFSDALVHMLSGARVAAKAAHSSLHFPGAISGSVLRPGETLTLMDLQNPIIAPLIERHIARMDMRVCYCSLLGQCWIGGDAAAANRLTPDCTELAKLSIQAEDPAQVERTIRMLGL